ncbi:MAG: KH domain-containing protein [Christensenellaceae bacterium]
MDFRVAGTEQGITAIQMDIKIRGISKEIMLDAIAQAQDARRFILDKMLACIPEVKESFPSMRQDHLLQDQPRKIGDVVGKQGKVINKIIRADGHQIDIEEDGTVCIACYGDVSAAERAKAIVQSIAHDPEVGDMFVGVVVRILSARGRVCRVCARLNGMVHLQALLRARQSGGGRPQHRG